MENQIKRSYFFNVTEVKDNKTAEVMNFNFGGHHDLAALVESVKKLGLNDDEHAKELALGIRFLHHVLKKYPDVAVLSEFRPVFDSFKKKVESICC